MGGKGGSEISGHQNFVWVCTSGFGIQEERSFEVGFATAVCGRSCLCWAAFGKAAAAPVQTGTLHFLFTGVIFVQILPFRVLL
jgi:hypothetical protein